MRKREQFRCSYEALTERGDTRKENQDYILCRTSPKSEAAIFLVADGMGGLDYGSQVSAFTAAQFESWWNEDFPQMILAGRDREDDIKELLEQEIWDINSRIYAFKEGEGCRCGSTLSVLLLYKGRYYIENMGDSRIYRLRDGCMEQLTQDQSLAEQLIRENKMTLRERDSFSGRHVLTMCLGMFQIPRSGFYSGDLADGDIFLLCSDGLYGYTQKEKLESVLCGVKNQGIGSERLKHGVLRLRSLIEPGRAADNVSLILTEVSVWNAETFL